MLFSNPAAEDALGASRNAAAYTAAFRTEIPQLNDFDSIRLLGLNGEIPQRTGNPPRKPPHRQPPKET